MSKDDKIAEIKNNNFMSSFLAPQEPKQETITEQPQKVNTNINTPKKETKKDNLEVNTNKINNSDKIDKNIKKKTISTDKQGNIRKNKKGEIIYTKKDNYTITFKIDADIELYLRNINLILLITSAERGQARQVNATDYVNELIRADLKKRLGVKDSETDPNKWIDAVKEFCKKYGIDYE